MTLDVSKNGVVFSDPCSNQSSRLTDVFCIKVITTYSINAIHFNIMCMSNIAKYAILLVQMIPQVAACKFLHIRKYSSASSIRLEET